MKPANSAKLSSRAGKLQWPLTYSMLAIALFCAGSMKGLELAVDSPIGDRLWLPRPLLVLLVLFELGFAVWLLANIYPRWNRVAALLLFLGFFDFNWVQLLILQILRKHGVS